MGRGSIVRNLIWRWGRVVGEERKARRVESEESIADGDSCSRKFISYPFDGGLMDFEQVVMREFDQSGLSA